MPERHTPLVAVEQCIQWQVSPQRKPGYDHAKAKASPDLTKNPIRGRGEPSSSGLSELWSILGWRRVIEDVKAECVRPSAKRGIDRRQSPTRSAIVVENIGGGGLQKPD